MKEKMRYQRERIAAAIDTSCQHETWAILGWPQSGISGKSHRGKPVWEKGE